MSVNDTLLDIATGKSRKETYWKNLQVTWKWLVDQLRETHRTAETYSEYMAMTKAVQDERKDIGGFVGGVLTGGKRNPGSVLHRSVLTLDADSATLDFWDDFRMLYSAAACLYSTHKHSEATPRYRLILPLSRPVDCTEYEAIGRRIAGDIDIEAFDNTGFQHYRLMYWPSTSKDGVYEFREATGPLLDVDKLLKTYHDYTDSALWPVSEKVNNRISREVKKQEDPLTKRGMIGSFCRAYTIEDVIDVFLSDVYEKTAEHDRYTYRLGSTGKGLVVYDNKFAYSHHGTDPISGKLCNAFDLVRIHLFGLRDEDVKAGTAGSKLPSYKAMVALAADDVNVKAQAGADIQEEAENIFSDGFEGVDSDRSYSEVMIDAAGAVNLTAQLAGLGVPLVPVMPARDSEEEKERTKAWMACLKFDSKMEPLSTTENIMLIMRNDRNLAGRFGYDEFKGAPVVLDAVPWQPVNVQYPRGRLYSDHESAGLRYYIETVYGINAPAKIKDAVLLISKENRFHPVINYLNSLSWDGVPRLDSLLTDYMGAEPSEYHSAVGRKWMCAAVARVFTPGVKADYTLTLYGDEGIYKSTFFNTLATPWFTDDFNFHMINSTRAIEQLKGKWIVEIGEMSGLNRAEMEGVKAFLVRQVDEQRGAYKENKNAWPRQNVFAGSTNKRDFLKGTTGNRRFWIVVAQQVPVGFSIQHLAAQRDQLWAEAVMRYNEGETTFLLPHLELIAKALQDEHTEQDDRFELVQAYLEKLLPENWENMGAYEKRTWLAEEDPSLPGTVERTRVSVAEIWVECLGCRVSDMNSFNTKPIHDIMKKMPEWEWKKQLRFGNYGRQTGYVKVSKIAS